MAVEIPCFIRFPVVLFLPEDGGALTLSGHVKKIKQITRSLICYRYITGFGSTSVSTEWNFYKLILTFLKLDIICSDNTRAAAPFSRQSKRAKIS